MARSSWLFGSASYICFSVCSGILSQLATIAVKKLLRYANSWKIEAQTSIVLTVSHLSSAERWQGLNAIAENKNATTPPSPPRECVVIVDLWNLRGTLKDSRLDEAFSFSGIKSLLELFDLSPSLLHVVGPVMQLQHGSVVTNQSAGFLQKSRSHISKIVNEAGNAGVKTPVTPPGGLWAGEIGVDAIIAMLALHYCSSSKHQDHEIVVLSSDKDLLGLRFRTKGPIVIGDFDSRARKDMSKSFRSQRFISMRGLHKVLVGHEPAWRPFFDDGCWKKPDKQNPKKPIMISSDFGNAVTGAADYKPERVGTTCIVDPYGLMQFGMRQLSIARLPNTESLNPLLNQLGFPRPYRSAWTIPDIRTDGNVDGQLKESFTELDSHYDELARTLRADHDPLTRSRRATQRVSSTFADRLIFEYGHERLLNHRWMKHLTTGLVNDLWYAMQSFKSGATDHVVVIGGNLELEYCIRVCSSLGPEEMRESLRQIIYIFAEPPTLRELNSQKEEMSSEWLRRLYGDQVSRARGQHGYVTLADLQLARLLRVDDGDFGRTLRLKMLAKEVHEERGSADPDTAIKMIARPGGSTYVPSPDRLAAKIRLDGTECEVLGVRKGPQSDTPVRWIAHFSTKDEALAPVLLPEGELVSARNMAQGDRKRATVVSRTARTLRVRLPDSEGNETVHDVAVGDLPHILRPGDEVTVNQIKDKVEKFVVLDVPVGLVTSDPSIVIVSSMTGNSWTVHPEHSPETRGTLVSYQLPFDAPPLKIGDRVLAMEIFNDPDAASESERRLYLALSSALPAAQAAPSSELAVNDDSSIVSVTYRDMEDE